jgi:hypothetical protein
MFDRTSTVTAVTNWPKLGVTLPKQLASKLDVFDAVRYVETAHAVQIDTASITTKNAEDAVAELAARLLPAQSEPGKLSSLDQAKSAIMNQLAGEILREASQALPDVIEHLRPGFERAVSAFAESVINLPEKLSSQALVAAGPSVLSEYQAALAASQFIHALDTWLASLKDLPVFAGLPPATPMLRVLAPATRGEYAKLRDAHEARNADAVEQELGTAYVCAVREGIAFSLNTPADSAQLLQSIESAPREKAGGVTYTR